MSILAPEIKSLTSSQFTVLPYPIAYKDIELAGSVFEIINRPFRSDICNYMAHLSKNGFNLNLNPIVGEISDEANFLKSHSFKASASALVKKLFTFGSEYEKVKRTEIQLEALTTHHLALGDILSANETLLDPDKNPLLSYFKNRKKSFRSLYYMQTTLSANKLRLTLKDEQDAKINITMNEITRYITSVKFNMELKLENQNEIVINHKVDLAYISQPITSLIPLDKQVIATMDHLEQVALMDEQIDNDFVITT